MRILCVAATPFEVLPLVRMLSKKGKKASENSYLINSIEVCVLVTGVGMMPTAFHLTKALLKSRHDLVINLGVAGALDLQLELAEVVEIASERLGDTGAESANAELLDLRDLKLIAENSVFDENGIMTNTHTQSYHFLKRVNGMTVNKVHGSEQAINFIKNKYPDVQVESMEGAAVFYACLNEKIPFLEIRSISNYVEPRKKENWQLAKAIDSLNEVAVELLKSMIIPN